MWERSDLSEYSVVKLGWGAAVLVGAKMVGGGGFFGAARGFLRYGSGVSWIKYHDGL